MRQIEDFDLRLNAMAGRIRQTDDLNTIRDWLIQSLMESTPKSWVRRNYRLEGDKIVRKEDGTAVRALRVKVGFGDKTMSRHTVMRILGK